MRQRDYITYRDMILSIGVLIGDIIVNDTDYSSIKSDWDPKKSVNMVSNNSRCGDLMILRSGKNRSN